MRIFVAGHRGMVGGAILRRLSARRDAGEEIETITASRAELDLANQSAVSDFLTSLRHDIVILSAAFTPTTPIRRVYL
jgi:GDP-L-fucose synthase